MSLWSDIKSLFSGSSSTTSSTSSGSGSGSGSVDLSTSRPPPPRPEVVVIGTGSSEGSATKGKTYLNTTTGKTYTEPTYSSSSFKGLTSTDPANVARNQYGASIQNAAPIGTGSGNSRYTKGAPSAAGALPPPAPKPTQQELASIGAPTKKHENPLVQTPSYGLPSLPGSGVGGYPTYGSAFNQLSAAPGGVGNNPVVVDPYAFMYGMNPDPYRDYRLEDIFGPFPGTIPGIPYTPR